MRTRNDTFSTYSPVINFLFFIGAIAFGMFFVHPAFLLCACMGSCAYFLTIRGVSGLKFIAGLISVFILLSVLNPLLNTAGDTVLFTWAGGRPYTLEALYYGCAIGAMFVAVILWFACYNAVMTSDKFMYLFGGAAPAISMILTMVLRLVPSYRRKLGQIAAARRCIGKGASDGTRRERLANGMTELSSLATWALEGGIVTADSMRSRGYGCGRRSAFSVYRFCRRDAALLVAMLTLAIAVLILGIMGAAETSYTPRFEMSSMTEPAHLVALVCYAGFAAIPTLINIREAIRWRILRSRI